MRKFLVVFLVVAIALSSVLLISGCGCDKTGDNTSVSSSPKTDIIGDWGGRSDDVEVSFNDDGTCNIGNVKGTYEIDDNDNITVTPLFDDNESSSKSSSSMTFNYYSAENGSVSDIPRDSWTILDGKLYINGYQYEKESNNVDTSSKSSNDSQSGNSNGNSSSDLKLNNSSSSNSSSSNSSSSNSSSSNSKTNSKTNAVENETIPSQADEEFEDSMITIYENLDDFE